MDSNQNKKILIVDDEDSFLNVLAERFKLENFEVFTEKNGKAGLKTALKKHPDIILLDILMPKMGGLDMLKELRADVWGEKAVIVLLTNLNADDEIMKAVVKYEPAFYLVKTSWKLDDVVKKVKQAVGLIDLQS
ncbi:MAG: response regulator [Candidatus Pacebacteria bacterium]|nr:response regulator [Candidatus Paceibacterota bacterium]